MDSYFRITSITMAVNKAICGILKYEKVLGNAVSNMLCKIGIQHLCINLFMDNFTCQEAFCYIRLTELQYTPNTNIKNTECSIQDANFMCVCVCVRGCGDTFTSGDIFGVPTSKTEQKYLKLIY